MRIKKFLHLFIALALISCHKDKAVTRVVEFNSTTYQSLGTYDSLGEPGYLLPKDSISPSLLSFIHSILPNGQNVSVSHPELLNNPAIGDVTITQPSDVFITFVSQGGTYTNTFAFYTYPTNQSPTSTKDIKVITYVFPNSGGLTPLKAGDKVKIGRFDAGTSIGFVMLQRSWDTVAHAINNKVVHFCTNDVLNPEVDPKLKKHAVLINYPAENKIIIGFEDKDRTRPDCDNDFNDLVVYCTVAP